MNLENEDFKLIVGNGRVCVTARYPTSGDGQVCAGGSLKNAGTFYELYEKSKIFERDDLREELKLIHDELLKGEDPIILEDKGESLEGLNLVHSLVLRVSKRKNRIFVEGSGTREVKDRFSNAGLKFRESDRRWVSKYDEGVLRNVVRIVLKEDVPKNPLEVEYKRCPECHEWIPRESFCCGSG